MSRTAKLDSAAIIESAMHFFWENGFNGSSVDALVKEVGTTRFSLYQLFGDKDGLYAAALDHYSDNIVAQALMQMREPHCGFSAVKNYFDFLISTAQRKGCIGRGCLMANTMVEFGSDSSEIASLANRHFERIVSAIEDTLQRSEKSSSSKKTIHKRALFLATFAQGLWLRARAGDDAKTLRHAYETVFECLEE
jgi:TetR/AcrR family transcriptional regulator, transcriptional repressor for nem operon